jgi:TetR/AcrR family transcriptional repressor of nem operon
MGHSQAEKAATHSRVLRLASRKVRTEGVTRPGVAELMKEAGLTHGGFYKHFASRDDLIAQAAALALAEGTIKMQRSARKNEQDPRAGLIDAYLAKQHRDTPDTGCALVSLGASAGRGGQDFKEAYEKRALTTEPCPLLASAHFLPWAGSPTLDMTSDHVGAPRRSPSTYDQATVQ